MRLRSDGWRAAAAVAVAGRDDEAEADGKAEAGEARSAPTSERPRCMTPTADGAAPIVEVEVFEFTDTV